MARDFQVIMNDIWRLSEMRERVSSDDTQHTDNWGEVQKAQMPLTSALKALEGQYNLQSIDVDSLYDMYQKVIDVTNNALKQAPETERIKKYASYVNDVFTKEEFKASAEKYIADFNKPFDVDEFVHPRKPLKYSENPLEKKKQQAALKMSFWGKYKRLYRHDDNEDTINKAYNKCAKAIEDGTDENLIILNKVDQSKVEMMCDMILSKGGISSLIDFDAYSPNSQKFIQYQKSTEKAFEVFFNPQTSQESFCPGVEPEETSQKITAEADQKIHAIQLPVPEGLSDHDVALLAMSEFFSDEILNKTYTDSAKYGGTTILVGTDTIAGARMKFAVNLLDNDERPNAQYMRFGVADARAKAKDVLAEFAAGNKKPMADDILHSLIENAKHQKAFMAVGTSEGAFYSKCISDAIELLDSDKFKGLVEIPKEVRDIDKLNKANLKMTQEEFDLRGQLNDYCLTQIQNGSALSPKDDPKFVELYSKWYARASHIDMVSGMIAKKRTSAVLTEKNEEAGMNRELTAYENKVIENADEYISLREKFFVESDIKNRLFEKDYTSWTNVLSKKIKMQQSATIYPVTYDLLDEELTNRLKYSVEGVDKTKYPGFAEKILSRPPFDGTRLSKDASQADIDFRIKQYEETVNYIDSLNLGTVPYKYAKNVIEGDDLRHEFEFEIKNFKQAISNINSTVAEARKFEKSIGIFEKESNQLQEVYAQKTVDGIFDKLLGTGFVKNYIYGDIDLKLAKHMADPSNNLRSSDYLKNDFMSYIGSNLEALKNGEESLGLKLTDIERKYIDEVTPELIYSKMADAQDQYIAEHPKEINEAKVQLEEEKEMGVYFDDSQFDLGYLSGNLGSKNPGNLNMNLFPDGDPKRDDVKQRDSYACFLLAPLADMAEKNPKMIQDMIKDNNDGTATVTFYTNNQGNRVPFKVRVDKTLSGMDPNSAPWVGIVEKAFAASRLAGSNGNKPSVSKLNNKITLDAIDGAEPWISMQSLMPQVPPTEKERDAVQEGLKQSMGLKEAYEGFEATVLKEAGPNTMGFLTVGNPQMGIGHVISFSDVHKDSKDGEVYLKIHDQQSSNPPYVSSLKEVFNRSDFYDGFSMYNLNPDKPNEPAKVTSISLVQVKQQARLNKMVEREVDARPYLAEAIILCRDLQKGVSGQYKKNLKAIDKQLSSNLLKMAKSKDSSYIMTADKVDEMLAPLMNDARVIEVRALGGDPAFRTNKPLAKQTVNLLGKINDIKTLGSLVEDGMLFDSGKAKMKRLATKICNAQLQKANVGDAKVGRMYNNENAYNAKLDSIMNDGKFKQFAMTKLYGGKQFSGKENPDVLFTQYCNKDCKKIEAEFNKFAPNLENKAENQMVK